MAQDFDTTIGLAANVTSIGQPVDFDGAAVSGFTIYNNSGISIQYSLDGSTWKTVANAATASPSVTSPSAFRLRKSTSDSYPVSVRLVWSARDGVYDPAGGAIDGQPVIRASMVPNWRKALADVLSSAGRGRILFLGDSTTAGSGSVAGLAGAGVKNGSYVARFASLLSSSGIAAVTHSAFGEAGYGANITTYDTRIVQGNWSQSGGIYCPGGVAYTASSATASPLAFTPTGNTDTCEIYYATNTGLGSFNANVNGGTNTLTNTSGAAGVSKVTITGTLGANTYNCSWASGGTVFIFGWIAYDSTAKQVSVVNMGRASAVTDQLANGPWQGGAAHIAAVAPNLTSIQIGINDWNNGISLATYSSNLQTIISGALAVGDCILMSPLSSNPNVVAASVQAPYLSAAQALAASNGIPYIDTNYRWGGFAAAYALGMYYSDGVHPSATGYADEARNLFRLLNV